MKIKQNNKAFTIIELIIIILILSILGTIGYVSFINYKKYAKNAVRTSDVKLIQKNLNYIS